MCGIAGIVDFAGRPIDEGRLRGACDTLAHRGPDDRGIWRHQAEGWSVGLAHTRLAVIDPAPEAHQPMLTPDGRWAIAYNGELYNYRQVARDLPQPPRTASDTEVFLQACRNWGPTALERFDGMWATAIVDTAGRTGHISRDPMGIKPLYHVCLERKLVFASELRTLVRMIDVPLQIDSEAVACYLQLGFIPHPMTIYRHMYKLPPGHLLRFDASGVGRSERYWAVPVAEPDGTGTGAGVECLAGKDSREGGCGKGFPHRRTTEGTGRQAASGTVACQDGSREVGCGNGFPHQRISYSDACREVRRLLEAAVDRQCVADVPLGAFLSGGLDSSAVVACMARRGGPPVKTFSIGYADHPRYDETQYARQVARHLGTEHHEFRLTFADVLAAVEPMLNHLGEPFADSSLLPTSVVSRYTRQHVTVALSGDGGDELFGGYWRYLGHHYLQQYRRVPAVLRRGVIEPLLRLVPDARSTRKLDRLRQLRKLLRGDVPDAMDRHLAWARLMDAGLAGELLGSERAGGASETVARIYREGASGGQDAPTVDPLQKILRADLGVGLPADMLFKVDTASMYHSLEVRVPLLSIDLVQYVTALPLEYKIRGTTGKRILRDAVRDMLPDEVFNRPKMGFEVPVGEFLRNELRDAYTSTVTPAALSDFGIDPVVGARVFDDHLHRRRDRTELLWALFVLCWWGKK